MEKYGILHEYKCDCGYCIILRDNSSEVELTKQAGIPVEGHLHILKEVFDGTQSSNIRSEQHPGTS